MRRGGGLLFWGEAGFERRLCGAVVAAVPRKRSGNRRCVSWSKGTGCGGAESLSFGERTGSNGCSAGRWLLPLPGNGPGTGGVFLGRRGRAAAGRRASLSGRGRIRTRHPSPPLFASAVRCYHPPPATTRRLPPPAACHYPPPATSATVACHPCRCLPSRCCRLPPACHYPPPATSAADCVLTACVSTVCRFSPLVITTCTPAATARRLPPSSFPCLSSSAVACTPAATARRYRPPPASFLLPLPVIIRCCLHPRRFSPAAPAASHPAACVPAACVPAACYLRHRCLPPLSLSASPLPVAFPRLLSPAVCRPLPPPLSASPLLPAVPPLLTSRTRCLPFPPPCAGRADRWAAAAPRVVGRGAMRRRREVLRNNLENRKILPIFVSVKYRGSGLSRPGFLFFIGLSFLWQKRLSI